MTDEKSWNCEGGQLLFPRRRSLPASKAAPPRPPPPRGSGPAVPCGRGQRGAAPRPRLHSVSATTVRVARWLVLPFCCCQSAGQGLWPQQLLPVGHAFPLLPPPGAVPPSSRRVGTTTTPCHCNGGPFKPSVRSSNDGSRSSSNNNNNNSNRETTTSNRRRSSNSNNNFDVNRGLNLLDSPLTPLKKNGRLVFKAMSSVLMGILKWALKRWAIVLAAVLLAGFVRYGSAGTIKMLPFLPPLKQKARTLSDWSSLAAVYGVVVTFIAAIMTFGMADSAIELAANNRKEDQAREDRFREEDGQERREERQEDKLERQQERLERKQERQEDKLERQQERLEDVLLGLHRERRKPLLFPWDRQDIEEEIKITTGRLKKLQEKIDTLQ